MFLYQTLSPNQIWIHSSCAASTKKGQIMKTVRVQILQEIASLGTADGSSIMEQCNTECMSEKCAGINR